MKNRNFFSNEQERINDSYFNANGFADDNFYGDRPNQQNFYGDSYAEGDGMSTPAVLSALKSSTLFFDRFVILNMWPHFLPFLLFIITFAFF